MRLFRRFSYRLTKKDSTGALFHRAREVLSDIGSEEIPILFYFADSGHGTVSAVQRAAKKFPDLGEFEYFVPAQEIQGGLPAYNALSNLPPPWHEQNPNGKHGMVSPDILGEIANGIPRTYPFFYATFIFDRIHWLKCGMDLRPPAIVDRPPSAITPQEYVSSSIILQSNWWTTRREVDLCAVIEIDPPDTTEDKLRGLDKAVQNKLERLGRIGVEQLVAAPTDEESAFLKSVGSTARSSVDAINANFVDLLKRISLPCDLAHPAMPLGGLAMLLGPHDPISPKEVIIETFKPRGYKYISKLGFRGGYFTLKRTTANNQIMLYFHLAPMAKALSCTFAYQGPLWEHSLDIRFSPLQVQKQYGITGPEDLERAIRNAGAIVDHLEETLVRELDDIYGPAPAWFQYQK